MRLAILVMLVAALAGCATTPKPLATPPEPPRLDTPDSTVMADCASPVVVPSRTLTQQQLEAAWGTDTDHLIDCGRRHRILADYIRSRDAGLAGSTSK